MFSFRSGAALRFGLESSHFNLVVLAAPRAALDEGDHVATLYKGRNLFGPFTARLARMHTHKNKNTTSLILVALGLFRLRTHAKLLFVEQGKHTSACAHVLAA